MLIRFHVSNFLSFNQEVEFSMIPGRARKHPEHVVKGNSRNDIDILRTAVIYGANASGKSNLVKAIDFARNLILRGTRAKESIQRIPFKLSRETVVKPSKFEFEFKKGIRCYIYGFTLDNYRIYEEWLYEIKKTTEHMLFERFTTPDGETSVEFGKIKFANKKENEFLEFVAMGTRRNQLFLTESIDRDVDHFEPVYKWFNDTLVTIFPHSIFLGLGAVEADSDFAQSMVGYLEQLGTGICGFQLRKVNPETEFPNEILDELEVKAENKPVKIFITGPDSVRYFIEYLDNGEIKASKLMFMHKMIDCDDEILLDITEESDGTKRLMDLLPSLANLAAKNKVLIVDELDRSLHPQLSYELIRLFLQNVYSQSQLIATTHEAHLLDLELLRRDEIWFIEKDQTGASHVYSLEEFAPRYDKDIERGYLMGRFGAIPVFGNISFAPEGG